MDSLQKVEARGEGAARLEREARRLKALPMLLAALERSYACAGEEVAPPAHLQSPEVSNG